MGGGFLFFVLFDAVDKEMDIDYQDNTGYQYYDFYLGGERFFGEEAVWFQGYEEIFYIDEKLYECYFHGGTIR